MSNRLKAGELAPRFTAVTFDGTKINLAAYEGSIVWLIFYRYPGCPICNLHMGSLRKRYDAMHKAGLKVIAVFESPSNLMRAQKLDTQGIPFPIIADPDRVLYEAYGAEAKLSGLVRPPVFSAFAKAIMAGERQGKIEGNIAQIPAHFLIAEDGTIETAFYGTNIVDHIPWEWVESFIEEHRVGHWQVNAFE